jgi:hypothetical protein
LLARFGPVVHDQHAVSRPQRVHGDLQAFLLSAVVGDSSRLDLPGRL